MLSGPLQAALVWVVTLAGSAGVGAGPKPGSAAYLTAWPSTQCTPGTCRPAVGEETEVTPTRGTRLAYGTYEAEDSGCTGTILGPDYRAYTDEVHLASEASKRMACLLSPPLAEDGPRRRHGRRRPPLESVTLTLRSVTNALRVRYSIPDAAKGGGARDMLLITAGAEAHHVELTSEYSWYYGEYPFVNDPSAGKAHHFYDEVYVLLNSTAAAGTTVTLSHAVPARPDPPTAIQPPPPPPRRQRMAKGPDLENCSGLPAGERVDCGFSGITAAQCASRQCCWLPHPPPNKQHSPDCFREALPNCTAVPPTQKSDCGFNGINATECLARQGCCWMPITPNPTHIPFCFRTNSGPSPPPPPPPVVASAITIDVVNTYLLSPPLPVPSAGVNLIDFGGDPTGVKDSSAAFEAATAAALANNTVLWIPGGVFAMGKQLTLQDGVKVRGVGAW